MKRKICVVTGSRAEYGLLKPLLDEIRRDPGLKLQLIATGMHLSAEFGQTFKEIERDGYVIDRKIKILSGSDTPVAISGAICRAMEGCSSAYRDLKPDIVVLLGDRFEIFGAAAAAHVAGIPIAHLYGGEVTEGVIDDAFRHSITKMSHLHLVATKEYERRVVQLGENPATVFVVGSLGLYNLKKRGFLTRSEIERDLGITFKRRNLLVTFHPATLEAGSPGKQFQNLLDALDGLRDTGLIFTKSNADTYGRIINRMIERYAAKNPGKAAAFASLGHLRYLSLMLYVDGVVGNSSSGIIEAPAFKIGTVNVGDRQKGRARASSIIDCGVSKKDIRRALVKLYSPEFRLRLKRAVSPYKYADAAVKIKDLLKRYRVTDIMKKGFYDIKRK